MSTTISFTKPPRSPTETRSETCYGYDLPIITAEGIQETTVDPTSFGKVTVINFWYTACGPCVAELPYFDAVANEYADEASVIADEIVRDSMTPTSLSMNILKYEALLAVNAEKYKDYILSEIRRTYKIMLDAGSDTVWETILGEADFGGAGSLCHGWSALPIYYYHILGND